MFETIQPVIQHHIPHDLNPHTDICKKLKSMPLSNLARHWHL